MKRIIQLILIACLVWLSIPFNVLILGSDAPVNTPLKGSRSDGIIVVKVTPLLGKIKMVSVPRDTYTNIPCEKGGKQDKITHAFAFGGTQCAKSAVENLLNTKINYTVLFRFDDVMSLTDIIGGVKVTANHTFTQDGEKFVEGQEYNIKGGRALAYTRHRKSDGAFKRDERQRQVIQSIAKKLISPAGWSYIPSVYSYMEEKMEVKFNPLKIISALPAILINKSNFAQEEITGEGQMKGGVYYFIPNEKSLSEVKKDFKVYF